MNAPVLATEKAFSVINMLGAGASGGHVHGLLLCHRARERGVGISTQAAVVKRAGGCGVFLMYWGQLQDY